MGCGSAGQQFTNLLEPRFVNAARIRHNVVHDESNITSSRCFDDGWFFFDARRRRRLRDTEAVRGGGGDAAAAGGALPTRKCCSTRQ